MRGRVVLATYSLSVAAVQTLAVLSGYGMTWFALAMALVCAIMGGYWRRHGQRCWLLWVIAAALAGWGYASVRAHLRLADDLGCTHRDRVQYLDVAISGLSTGDDQRRRVVAEVLPDRPKGIPRYITITWYAPWRSSVNLPALVPGQRWRMALLLRPPRGR